MYKLITLLLLSVLLADCGGHSFNNPHDHNAVNEITYYSSFDEQPKTLDPARSYSANETIFITQIYEPPLQYHYIYRPYQLVPLTAAAMPTVKYYDKNGKEVSEGYPANLVDHSIYEITIQPNIYYQPHPAFEKSNNGTYLYHGLTESNLTHIKSPNDFQQKGTRELVAEDYVYEIKRLANPKVQSPIFGLMSGYIMGLGDFNKMLSQKKGDQFINLTQFNLTGARALNRYTYQIILKGKYPQFIYWLAMPFFSPVPWEADKFYSQNVLQKKNITMDFFPIGTGPYMMVENNPNREIILEKNPNFHQEFYPGTNEKLPFIDRLHLSLEKESIPRWAKFLQGYYDASGISSDNFEKVISLDQQGKPHLSVAMQGMNLKLSTMVSPANFYLGFNMLDSVVGSNTEQARKLRQAISIILDFEEYVSIFLNGQGLVAQGPIPPGVFGYQSGMQGIDPYIYDWINGKAERKNITEAKKLLAEAGYPNGIDPKTGQPLILYFDSPVEQGPDSNAMLGWLRKQFAKLGIQLNVRATQYNRFQEKMRTGNVQLYMWGWQADYPDPENFLFLLYGPNAKVKYGGENASNYQNPEYDALFAQMKELPNGAERQAVINKMLDIVEYDAPWAWGFFPKNLALSQEWVSNNKPNAVAHNTLKYLKIDKNLRIQKQNQWNKPMLWPLFVLLLVIIIIITPVVIGYWQRQHKKIKKLK